MLSLSYFLLLVASLSAVSGQNCGIVGHDDNSIPIVLQSLNETTPVDFLIWSEDTYNVTATAAMSSPFVKYIKGLRYPSRYQYLTSEVFPDFIQVERSNEIRRDVVFTCEDGKTKLYTFIIPVVDENTQPPLFTQDSYDATYVRSDGPPEAVNANIVISDGDLEYVNGDVLIRSSNAFVTPFVVPLFEVDYPDSYIYRADIFVSPDLEPGEYSVVLTADDGKHSDFAILHLTVSE